MTGNNRLSLEEKHALIECPHCQTVIKVDLQVTIKRAGFIDEVEGASHEDWKKLLSPEQLQVLEDAKQTGVLTSFETVTKTAKSDQIPHNIEHFFLNWLKTAKPTLVPSPMLQQLIRDFKGARIQFYSAQGVGVILADGAIRQFIPTHMVVGKAIRNPSGGLKARIHAEKSEFDHWIRTQFGFVAGKGPFFETMKKRSIGEFNNPVL